MFEILNLTDKMKAVVAKTNDAGVIFKAAREEGLSTLRESAVRKMLQGQTTYEEVITVT